MQSLCLLVRTYRLDLDPMLGHLDRHGPSIGLRARALCNRDLWNMCLSLGHGEMSVSFCVEIWISVARSGRDHGLLGHGLGDHLERTRQGVQISFQPLSCAS